MMGPILLFALLVGAGGSSQGPLSDFSVQCCPEGKHLANSSCVDAQGQVTKAVLPDCPHGMYMLDPNQEKKETFREVNGGLIEISHRDDETSEEFAIENGTWCAANAPPDEGNLTVALVCFPEDAEYVEGTVYVVYGLCLLLSFLFLVATLTVYVLLPELRDMQGLCLMANIFSLALGYLALSFIQLFGHSVDEDICIFSAFFLYYWFLSAFFWLNIVAYNVWRTIVQGGSGSLQKGGPALWAYLAWGWGAPGLLLVAAIATHFAPEEYESLYRPRFGEASCWFHEPEDTWVFFYGPICMIILANIYFFIASALQIRRNDNASTSTRSRKLKWMLYLKLFFVTGITWVFEVASFAEGSESWFWYITDVLNCLQGIFYFIILICRQRVLRIIGGSSWGYKILGSRFQGQVEELNSEEEAEGVEEVELANPS